MGTAPQPLQPPVGPPPPRPGSHIVAIVLMILALIIVVSGIAVWAGLRYLSRAVQVQVEGGTGKKQVSIKTPVGSLEVHKDINEAHLGLPIYPGAMRVQEEGSATVSIDLPNEQNLRVIAAKFETPDALEKVRDFYQERLGSEVSKLTERRPRGETVFEIRRPGQEKVVALRRAAVGTRIELVRVVHGTDTTN